MYRRKNDNSVFYVTHSIELLVWLIVVLLVVATCSILYMHNEKHNNDYSIFLPDIDGLIVGSPVRILGIDVGHVVKIKPVNDTVYVKFLITNKEIKIPQGTNATVEFSGMAGSKSLELYPPDEDTYVDETTPILQVSSPKRLEDALGLLSEMFNKMGKIITTISILGRNFTNIDMPEHGDAKDLSEFLKYSDKVLDESIQRTNEFEKRFLNNGQ